MGSETRDLGGERREMGAETKEMGAETEEMGAEREDCTLGPPYEELMACLPLLYYRCTSSCS